MKNMYAFLLLFLLSGMAVFAQVSINTDNSLPDNSAMLDVKSSDKGLLIPHLSQSQILAISNPANGLLVFCTTDNKFYSYVAYLSVWKELLYGPNTIPFTCGSSILVNHVAGNVAPVTKTVLYGTVKNIPGETSKCWITSNLGADHQAIAVDDATEASAGWYWQFNRKQGYKNDGTNVTPAWTITSINENLDWESSNDPCTLELGSGWRIPTYSEWINVIAGGGWTNWNGPWNSALRMHASGLLYDSDGSSGYRGSNGNYWSSTQSGSTNGWHLGFWDSHIEMYTNHEKTYGMTLRCLRDF